MSRNRHLVVVRDRCDVLAGPHIVDSIRPGAQPWYVSKVKSLCRVTSRGIDNEYVCAGGRLARVVLRWRGGGGGVVRRERLGRGTDCGILREGKKLCVRDYRYLVRGEVIQLLKKRHQHHSPSTQVDE